MTATVVILPSIEEQRAAGDIDIIDPAIVKVGDDSVTVFANFSHRVPEDVVGRLANIRVENGRLVGDIEALGALAGYLDRPGVQYGIAGIPRKYHLERDPFARVIEEMDLLSVGVTSTPPAKPKS